MKNTIQQYSKLETKELQTLLKKYESKLYTIDSKFLTLKSMDIISEELEKEMTDLEIDVSLIRTELNKRLWYETN